MTIQEFSTEFDVLYNNVTSNQAPGLNEYEKSVFLTKAQSQLVNEYFNSRSDGFGGGYDGSQKRQYDFSGLVRTETLYNLNTFKERIDVTEKLDRRSLVFLLPTNFYLAVNEILSDSKWQYSVIPIDYAEYQRLMLKPYNFPVKRAAWRIFTDKKNCNYVHEDSEGNDLGNTPAPADYSILSTWADQRRNLRIILKHDTSDVPTAISEGTMTVVGNTATFHPTGKEYTAKVIASCGWVNNYGTYRVTLTVSTNDQDYDDDEGTITILQDCFKMLKEQLGSGWSSSDSDLRKAADHTDGFQQAEAPSKLESFQTMDGSSDNPTLVGRTFNTKVIAIPIAEIIGRFSDTPNYQMRYVRTLSPIILDDLSNYGTDITIGGLSNVSESALPEETHHEILERAVTLAKIAWQGGTATQAAARQRSE